MKAELWVSFGNGVMCAVVIASVMAEPSYWWLAALVVPAGLYSTWRAGQ